MPQYASVKIFEEKKIRTSWDAENETWYYSIVDVVGVLTDQPDYRHASNYWKVLKSRLSKEGCELVTNCNQLKMQAEDGKMRMTDVTRICTSGRGPNEKNIESPSGEEKYNGTD